MTRKSLLGLVLLAVVNNREYKACDVPTVMLTIVC